MCRWLAYQGVPIYLDEVIYEPTHSLIIQSQEARKGATRVNADGFGVGGTHNVILPVNIEKCYLHGGMITFVL